MLLDDAELRREFNSNPRGVAARLGIELDDQKIAALTSFDWSGSSEELQRRVSKAGSCQAGSCS
jgi:hypothetical protein